MMGGRRKAGLSVSNAESEAFIKAEWKWIAFERPKSLGKASPDPHHSTSQNLITENWAAAADCLKLFGEKKLNSGSVKSNRTDYIYNQKFGRNQEANELKLITTPFS